ncbi:MAG: DUF882 domain-containing protein [Alphaproteobacteria bacterium]|nr:DUF882 domain-containing protein [Alphaproteobacteria bacterium]MCB9796060.1 DUF882 domain-containing protein [Alphaproteobacteria bacterium]
MSIQTAQLIQSAIGSIDLQERLAPNFTFAELTTTNHSELILENRKEAIAYLAKLRQLAALLQKIRDHVGVPVKVNSGFRSQALNNAVHGASGTSQHMRGEAVDFSIPGKDMREVWRWIAEESGLRFGQLIHEEKNGGVWIHISLETASRSGEVFTFAKGRYTAKVRARWARLDA